MDSSGVQGLKGSWDYVCIKILQENRSIHFHRSIVKILMLI